MVPLLHAGPVHIHLGTLWPDWPPSPWLICLPLEGRSEPEPVLRTPCPHPPAHTHTQDFITPGSRRWLGWGWGTSSEGSLKKMKSLLGSISDFHGVNTLIVAGSKLLMWWWCVGKSTSWLLWASASWFQHTSRQWAGRRFHRTWRGAANMADHRAAHRSLPRVRSHWAWWGSALGWHPTPSWPLLAWSWLHSTLTLGWGREPEDWPS